MFEWTIEPSSVTASQRGSKERFPYETYATQGSCVKFYATHVTYATQLES